MVVTHGNDFVTVHDDATEFVIHSALESLLNCALDVGVAAAPTHLLEISLTNTLMVLLAHQFYEYRVNFFGPK